MAVHEEHKDAPHKDAKEAEVAGNYATPTGENDETVPGGNYIRGGTYNMKLGVHQGGQIVNAEGEVLDEFAEHETNPGVPRAGKKKSTAEMEIARLRKELEAKEDELAQIKQDQALKEKADPGHDPHKKR